MMVHGGRDGGAEIDDNNDDANRHEADAAVSLSLILIGNAMLLVLLVFLVKRRLLQRLLLGCVGRRRRQRLSLEIGGQHEDAAAAAADRQHSD